MAVIEQLITNPGTYHWVCPSDVTSVKVEAWGAGGGGGIIATSAGGGGGGGAYARTDAVSVTPGNTYVVVVGAGGAADIAAGGGNSTFNSTTVVADGGNGTTGAGAGTGGTTANSTGADAESAGGNGGAGNTTGDVGGGGGGAGGTNGAGGVGAAGAAGVGGNGGQGNNGAGGAGGTGGNTDAGDPGTLDLLGGGGGGGGDDGFAGGVGGYPGGGGGGGEVAGGGTGADGMVRLTYTTAKPAPVQSLKASDGAGARSFLKGVTAGNLVVVGVTAFVNTPTASEITDNQGNTYTRIDVMDDVGDGSGDNWAALYYCKNIASDGGEFTLSQITSNSMFGMEFANCDTVSPLDTSTTNVGASTTPNASLTNAQADTLMVAVETDAGGDGDAHTPDANVGLLEYEEISSSRERGVTLYTVKGSGSQSIGSTLPGSTSWAVVVAGFKIVSSGESITPDKWDNRTSVPTRRRRSLAHITPIGTMDPYILSQPESVTADRSFRQVSDPTRTRTNSWMPYLAQTDIFAPETASLDRVFKQVSDPTRRRRTNAWMPHLAQSDIFAEEVVTIDRFAPQMPDMIFRTKKMRHIYPAYFGLEEEPSEQIKDDWQPQPQIPRTRRGLRRPHLMPDFQPISTTGLAAPEAVTLDRWRGYQADRVYRTKRMVHMYPASIYQLPIIPPIPIEQMLAAIYQTNQPYRRHTPRQYLYPTLAFKEPSVLFHPCPPYSDWTPVAVSTANWAQSDPHTTPWTQTAAMDATDIYDFDDLVIDFDDMVVDFDGMDGNLLEGSLADPPNTNWSKSDPVTGQWSTETPPTTDWETCGGSEG